MASQRSPSPDLPSNSDDDEEVIEIEDSRPVRKIESHSQSSTPHHRGNREETVTHSEPRSVSKRPLSQVIDLTLSDDDEPPRPAKRHTGGSGFHTPSQQNLTNGHNGHNGYNEYNGSSGRNGHNAYARSPISLPSITRPIN